MSKPAGSNRNSRPRDDVTTPPQSAQNAVEFRWEPASEVPPLEENEVHLWAAMLDRSGPELETARRMLSAAERAREKRFHFQLHADRFAAGRRILRVLLGEYLARRPEAVELGEAAGGKPILINSAETLRFNVTHGGPLLIAAFARREVGVDVEQVRPIEDRDLIAARFFADGERRRLEALPEKERDAAFLRCWTRKEACLKARGEGIAEGLKSFEVSFEPGAAPAIIAGRTLPSPSSLHHLDPAIGYLGALQVEHPDPVLQCFALAIDLARIGATAVSRFNSQP